MVELKGLQGNEICDDFKKTEFEEGRWRHTWVVFKTNFWKLVALNLLVLITFIPAIVVIYMRNLYIDSLSSMYPFNASIGYPFYPQEILSGLAERLVLWVDIRFYALLIAAGLIASVGISGAAYCIRKLLHTKNKFNIKGLLHGIKIGYLKTVLPVTVFMLFLYAAFLAGDYMDLTSAQNGAVAGAVTLFVFAVIFTVLAGIYLLWLFALGVSYRTKYTYILRNSFKLMFCTPIQTVFMAGFSLIPVWLALIFSGTSFWLILVYILFALFGFTFVLLSWLSFSQWACGLYLAPDVKVEAPKKNERELAAEAEDEKRRETLALLAAGKSRLIARPIKPIGNERVEILGKTFTRSQLAKACDTREKIKAEVLEYEKAHENEKEYVEYNRMFAEREKALVVDEGKGKKNKNKKVSAENLLR